MNKKIYLIFVPVIILVVFAIFIIYNNQKEKLKTFEHSGYILASSNDINDSDQILRYYFDEDENYKEKYNKTVSFNDTEGDKVTTSVVNFLHFNNQAISALSDGVILDLNKIDVKPITYYNIFKNTILYKNNDSYTIQNGKNNIRFDDFIWKISENKYIVVSKNIKLTLNNEENTANDYLEINFLDGGIVKLLNQSVSFQTVSSNAYLETSNGVVLNLNNRYLSKNNEDEIISLDQMVINSDDNIDVKPKTEKEDEELDKDNQNTSDNNDKW